jgi:hypothetical protein
MNIALIVLAIFNLVIFGGCSIAGVKEKYFDVGIASILIFFIQLILFYFAFKH